MADLWTNWSGSLRFRPGSVARPSDEASLAALVVRARQEGATLRPVGAGHSSSGLYETKETLVAMEGFSGVASADTAAGRALVGGGTRLGELGRALHKEGLALENYGDVDVQTVAGAIATGTHGSGRSLRNLATMLVGGRLVDGRGEVVEFDEGDTALLRGLRVSLGALGFLTHVRLRLLPDYRLRRQEWCAPLDVAWPHIPELMERHRNVDFYWYPRSDEVKLRILDNPDEVPEAPELLWARLVEERVDWVSRVLPQVRPLRFEEMEYALPADVGLACFLEVRERVKAVHRRHVGWRVLVRTVAADDAYLSLAHGRDTITVSLHHNAGLPFQDYFDDIEPLFRQYDGRPHWAKKHALTHTELAPLYPHWARFQDLRAKHDPDGVLTSPQMARLLGARP